MERILFLALLSGIQAKAISGPPVVTGRERESLSFCCSYHKDYKYKDKYWCRGKSFSSCSRQENGRTSFRDDPTGRVFCVTVKDLKLEDSGTYWCAISVWLRDEHVVVELRVNEARPSTAKPTTKLPTTVAPSPSEGSMATVAVTLEPITTPPVGSEGPEGFSVLTILCIATGTLLLFLCLSCVLAAVWWRAGSRGELERNRSSMKSVSEAGEINYAEVTFHKRSQPLNDFVTYGNLYFHATAEDQSPEGSVEYSSIKR